VKQPPGGEKEILPSENFVIETERLTLRKMTIEDLDDLLLIFSDPKVMESFNEPPFDRQKMEKWVQHNLNHQERHGYGIFCAILKENNELAGACGLHHMKVDDTPEVELGYDFRSAYWNRGLATEAAKGVRDWAFDQLGLTRLISLIRTHNKASMRVAEKMGMVREKEWSRGDIKYHVYSQFRQW
jgi:RimJ/RimL family protein N-acetyltransferase